MESGVRLPWGPNVLEFADEDEAQAFAVELGCEAVSYWSFWYVLCA